MPIYNKPPPQASANKGAAKIDDHASEAAKVKRTREQAYFNSYNFDAIEVLPYDNDDDDDDGMQHSKTSASTTNKYAPTIRVHSPSSHSHKHLPAKASLSSKSSSTNSSRSNSDSYLHSQHNDIKYTNYLQRVGAFFTNSSQNTNNEHVKNFPVNAASTNRLTATYHQTHKQQQLQQPPSQHSSSTENNEVIMNIRNNGDSDAIMHVTDNGNFLLPRAMLKYQSVSIANSMPLAVISSSSSSPLPLTTTTTIIAANAATAPTTTHTGISKILQNGNSNNNSTNNNKKPMSLLTSNTANILYTNGSSINNNKTRLHHLNGNNNDGHTGFLITTAKENISATNLPSTTSQRIKKQSTSSTATTASDSAVSVQHNLTSPHPIGHEDHPSVIRNKILSKSKIAASSIKADGGEQRGRSNSHQSHYSTDKSASSGYYSSNVCSTYSLEDHIYCEPVIAVLDRHSKSKSGSIAAAAVVADSNNKANMHDRYQQMPKKINNTIVAALATTTTNANSKVEQNKLQTNSLARVMNGVGQSKRYGADTADATEEDEEDEPDGGGSKGLGSLQRESETFDTHNFNDNLRILETSIENLDRHLRNFPSLSSQERIASFMYSHQACHPPHYDMSDKSRAYKHLPTIMEGYDPANQPRPWQDEITDDSLLDIDLDSFLLSNERKNNTLKNSKPTKPSAGATATPARGIDNPSFLADEQEENNYKCAKYINSCPEDAYRVDSDILSGTGGTASQKSISMEHFLKRYEDQLHFQSTRELLEDVRDKIRLLSQSSVERRSSSSGGDDSQTNDNSIGTNDEEMPKELEGMIATLKHELETYLQRMNQHSELEIRQLCSGLVKNQNIVKMKNAFERRRSTTSLNAIDAQCGCGVHVTASGVPISIREHITSIRCASDPNFKMKRKSLAEIFPLTDCYIETNSDECGGDKITQAMLKTQLQRNLTFHKPVLNKLDSKVGQNAIGSGADGIRGNDVNGSSGGSGAETGDKNNAVDWHRKRPSIWEMYYGTNRMNQSLLGKRNSMIVNSNQATMSYPSSRPESDFTLDLPRAEQLRIKMEKEKKFRQRCRYITTFLSLIFFLLTVMVVSLVLTRGKRMFGSMI